MNRFDYRRLVQDAMRGVVRAALAEAAQHGLVDEHYFYVEYQTSYPGVELAKSLRDLYPATMTIVLQHQYEDLEVAEDSFSVTLRFNGVWQRLTIPYRAIDSFYDPGASFVLKFEPDEGEASAGAQGARGGELGPRAVDPPEDGKLAGVVRLDEFRKR